MSKKTGKREPISGDEMLDISADGEITVMKYFDPTQKQPSDGSSFTTKLITGQDAFGNKIEVDFGGAENLEAAKFEVDTLARLQAESHERRLDLVNKFGREPELLKAALDQLSPAVASVQVDRVMTIEELADNYISYRRTLIKTPGNKKGSITERTFKEELPRVAFWISAFAGKSLHELRRGDIVDVADWLKYLPSRFTLRKLSNSQAIEIAKENMAKGEGRLAVSTYNKWAIPLRGMLRRAFKLGATEVDLEVFIECYDAKDKQESDVQPFSITDLKKIFPGSNYGEKFLKASKLVSAEAKFWLPLVGLFSGCRLEEMAQLTVADVKKDQSMGIQYLVVTNEGVAADDENQSTKNLNSVRPVPIHPTLVEIGFLDYVEERTSLGPRTSLFNLTRSTRDRFSDQFSKYFTRKGDHSRGYLERCGIETRRTTSSGSVEKQSFHSLRHTTISKLYEQNVPAEQIALVMGQKGRETYESENYRKKSETDRLSLRQSVIEQVTYVGVDFGSIKWGNFEIGD